MQDGADAAAKALGMTSAELRAELRSGKDLKAIAAEKGVPYATVTAAALAPVKARLDAAVAAGTLTQARADKILAKLEKSLADGRLAPRPSRRRRRRRAVDPGAQSKTMTWRSPSPERRRSKAGSSSSRPIRRSMSRSTGSRPSRYQRA